MNDAEVAGFIQYLREQLSECRDWAMVVVNRKSRGPGRGRRMVANKNPRIMGEICTESADGRVVLRVKASELLAALTGENKCDEPTKW